MARYSILKVGKAMSIEDLRKSPAPRGRKPNPRDEELKLLVREVSVGPESQVIPWELGNQKVATARLAANKVIKQLGVPVYTIALGTPQGIVDVPNRAGVLVPMLVPPDPETLATVAEVTGGRFFEAPTAQDLAAIYESLGSRVGFLEEQREVTQLFAAAGLAFVVLGAALAAHWFNRFP